VLFAFYRGIIKKYFWFDEEGNFQGKIGNRELYFGNDLSVAEAIEILTTCPNEIASKR
jgi:hypothetical protein